MGKFFDYIIFCILTIALSYSWCRYFGLVRQLSIGVSICIIIVLSTVYATLNSGLRRKKLPTYDSIFFAYSVIDTTKITKLFADSIPEKSLLKAESPFVIVYENNNIIAYMINFKFSATSQDDVAKAYRFAIENDVDAIKILSRGVGKGAREVATRLKMKLEFPSKRTIRNYAVKHCLIPELPPMKNATKIRFHGIKDAFEAVTDGSKMKYYLISALILLFSAYFTKFKLYYLISAIIPVMLCVACLVRKILDKS